MLIAGLGGIAQLGLRESLVASDRTIVTEEIDAARVYDRTAAAMPDGVVLDLDATGGAELAADLATRFPSVTVVACSMLEPLMRVYPASARGRPDDAPDDVREPYNAPLTASALAAALTSST